MTSTATLSRLMDEMSRRGDFPAISSTLARIQSLLNDEERTDARLVDAVLGDFALTQKVLRLANSAMYSAFGGAVSTVSKAVYILGTETVGHLAMGLKLIDNLGQAAKSASASRELSKAVIAGVVARRIGGVASGREAEIVTIATLLRSLGRLLVCVYLPQRFAAVQARRPDPDSEEAVSAEVLGMSYSQLACSVCRHWALPRELAMHVAEPLGTEDAHQSWVHSVAGYSLRYVDAVSREAAPAEIEALAARYAEPVGLPAERLRAVSDEAIRIAQVDEAQAAAALAIRPAGAAGADSASAPVPLRTTLQKLAAGLSEVQGMEGALSGPRLRAMTLEVLLEALDANRVLFFQRRPTRKCYELALGMGLDVEPHMRRMQFEEAFSPNVFHIALAQGSAVHLADTTEPNIARRIPAWFAQAFPAAKSLLLLPLGPARQPVGLLCLDWGAAGRAEPLKEEEFRYVERIKALIEKSLG
ncbi:HDOD domain-containing protein [Caldimonas tepidiphila]|uniref:HDOD domain-containing protein n=1 Tax=Caldimonas tepidiphila TaxID=2315841 RepID=UPI000E5A8EDC|nr:HDOD domain-containing protein [Caldimonas tepidiphila]